MYRPPGPIDMNNASHALADGLRAIASGETEISLAELAAAGSDSSAVAVFLAWRRQATQQKQRLIFSDIPPSLASLAHLYGVFDLLPGFGGEAASGSIALPQ